MTFMATNIYLDFDGVINVFGHDHPHLRTPEHPKGFTVNKKTRIHVPDMHTSFNIRWPMALTDRIMVWNKRECPALLHWLSTWQDDMKRVNHALGFPQDMIDIIRFFDPETKWGIWNGKMRVITDAIKRGDSPIIWIDDDEISDITIPKIRALTHNQPVLLVRPDPNIGLSKRQTDLVEQFIDDPNQFSNDLIIDIEPTAGLTDPFIRPFITTNHH